MRKLGKKIIALVAVATMAMTSLVGCGSVDDNAVVVTVGDDKVTAGFVDFYMRYQQALMQEDTYASYYGEDFWDLELIEEGKTYEESVKESIIETLQTMYIVGDHAEEYDVTLTEEELADIEAAAEAFDKANDAETKEKVSADKEMAIAYLKLRTIAFKMGEAMVADVNTEVSDEEAAQKRMRYVLYATSTTSDDGTTIEMSEEEVKDKKADAETTLANAKANGSLETYAKEKSLESKTLTFDSESTDLAEEVIKAADALEEGGFAELIETEDGFYVIQLESKLDREATDAEKETIVTTRKNDKYSELVDEWTEATKIELNEKVYKKLSIQKMKVNQKEEKKDTDESTEKTE